MRKPLLLLFCCGLLMACRSEPLLKIDEAPITAEPDRVELVTSDIELFWTMYDREKPLYTRDEVLQQYVGPGSEALKRFYADKIEPSDALLPLLNSWIDRMYYDDIRGIAGRIHEQQPAISEVLAAFKNHYAEAIFPRRIHFVIGAMNTGGVVLPNGQVVIAAEMYGLTEKAETGYLDPWLQQTLQTADRLPILVLHEIVHLQQRRHSPAPADDTLLERALREGGADFITQLVTGDFLNRHLLAYGNPREQALWEAFSKRMNRQDYSGWLYNGQSSDERPADLGYFIGYKIAEYYYRRSDDKDAAVRAIIEMKDGAAFLEASGYARQFSDR